jgi:hypothetical protein
VPADINTVTGALKLYLRELPENILTSRLLPEFEDAGRDKNIAQLVELTAQLPMCNRLMIQWLLLHMKHISENVNMYLYFVSGCLMKPCFTFYMYVEYAE